MKLPPGTRIRVNRHSSWPERVGCVGVIVQPPVDGTYPQPAANEELVLLDDDPYGSRQRGTWSCVMPRTHLDVEDQGG